MNCPAWPAAPAEAGFVHGARSTGCNPQGRVELVECDHRPDEMVVGRARLPERADPPLPVHTNQSPGVSETPGDFGVVCQEGEKISTTPGWQRRVEIARDYEFPGGSPLPVIRRGGSDLAGGTAQLTTLSSGS
ncbi:MAG: hypothetical protein AB1894_00245 [Chloroflexota bacterium]